MFGTCLLTSESPKSIIFFFLFTSGSLHLELNNLKEAEKVYKELLRRNPENKAYYEGLEKSLQLGECLIKSHAHLTVFLF